MMSGRAASIGQVNADTVLRQHGMDGHQLLKLAYQAANTYAHTHPSFPASRVEDMAMHCVEQVCRRAPRYDADRNTGFDPTKNPHSTPFRSWCWMSMEQACLDFVRKRSEGFVGRIGRDKEITVQLTATPEDHFVEHQLDDFELAMDERRLKSWAKAAARVGLSVPEWLAVTADHAARELLEAA